MTNPILDPLYPGGKSPNRILDKLLLLDPLYIDICQNDQPDLPLLYRHTVTINNAPFTRNVPFTKAQLSEYRRTIEPITCHTAYDQKIITNNQIQVYDETSHETYSIPITEEINNAAAVATQFSDNATFAMSLEFGNEPPHHPKWTILPNMIIEIQNTILTCGIINDHAVITVPQYGNYTLAKVPLSDIHAIDQVKEELNDTLAELPNIEKFQLKKKEEEIKPPSAISIYIDALIRHKQNIRTKH